MSKPTLTDRKPIKLLYKVLRFIAPNLEAEMSSYRFDMFREFSNCTIEAVANFCFIEHLLRVTTPVEEVELAERVLPFKAFKLVRNMDKKHNYVFENLQMLQAEFDSVDFVSLPPMYLEMINLTASGLSHETFMPEEGSRWPYCYLLQAQNKIFSLYTNGMTLVDCFDPFSGDRTYPLMTQQIIVSVRKTFYKQTKARSFGIQTDFVEDSTFTSPELSIISAKPRKVPLMLSAVESTNHKSPKSPRLIIRYEADESAEEEKNGGFMDVRRIEVSDAISEYSITHHAPPGDADSDESSLKATEHYEKPVDNPKPSEVKIKPRRTEPMVVNAPLSWDEYAHTISNKRRDDCTELSNCNLL